MDSSYRKVDYDGLSQVNPWLKQAQTCEPMDFYSRNKILRENQDKIESLKNCKEYAEIYGNALKTRESELKSKK